MEPYDNMNMNLIQNLCTDQKFIIMSSSTIRLLAFITLLVHGIGHIQGVVGALGVKFNESSSSTSWLLKDLGQKSNQTICLILYLGAAVLGILTALSMKDVILASANWQNLALITTIVSSFCLLLFPNSLAMFFNKAGAIAVNLIIYYSVLFNGQWPSELFQE
jgi:hypothetical protein